MPKQKDRDKRKINEGGIMCIQQKQRKINGKNKDTISRVVSPTLLF